MPTQSAIPPVFSGRQRLGGENTIVMGVLNVTPDSFSDGGLWVGVDDALRHGVEMMERGASIVDVGGESTSPKAPRVSPKDEWKRIGAVVKSLVEHGVPVSVDTVNSTTAKASIEHGAVMINDVSGGLNDPQMMPICAAGGVAVVVQHWRGFPSDPSLNQSYVDPVEEVCAELAEQIAKAESHGVRRSNIVADPGLGFALEHDHSWAIVKNLERLRDLGYPVLIGASRKRFVVSRYGAKDVEAGTLDVTRRCVEAGMWGVRVHDVGPNAALIRGLRGD